MREVGDDRKHETQEENFGSWHNSDQESSPMTGKSASPVDEKDVQIKRLPSNLVPSPEDRHLMVLNPDQKLHYNIEDNPPIHLTLLFGLQQSLISLSGSLTVSLIVAELVCAHNDEHFKAQLLCTTMFMSGICTFLQSTIGIRLPLYQGPSIEYIIPLMAMSSLSYWKCADPIAEGSLNSTTNITEYEQGEQFLPKVQLLQGSLMLAGAVHFLIGFTGMVGALLSIIGPITIVSAMTLVGLFIFKVAVKFSEPHWGIALATASFAIIVSLYCNKKIPVLPTWSRERGCHTVRYPLHKVFTILFAIVFGWSLSAVLTETGTLSDGKESVQYYARTDSRTYVIKSISWLYFPYPGQFGAPGFSLAAFTSFIIATLASIIDSIGDYYACARMCGLPPPPKHAVNRGIAVEGLASSVAGALGAGHATSTYGGNIGAIGITKVGSRRVFQCVGLIFILFGIMGKLGAVFITIPYPVLGGVQIVSFGIFIGLVLSNLMYIDLSSTRNLAIIGISLLVGLMMPHWIQRSTDPFNTGITELDNILQTLLANPNFVGGALACFLDNTVPGTRKERGFESWQTTEFEMSRQHATSISDSAEEALQKSVYDLPLISRHLKQSKWTKYIPFLPGYYSVSENKCGCFTSASKTLNRI